MHNGGHPPSHETTPTGTLEHHRNGDRNSPRNRMSPTGSYTSGSTLSLNHHGNANSSPLRTIDHAFVGMDNYGFERRPQSHYGVAAPEYNEAIHGPSRISYMSSVGSDDTTVPIMDSKGTVHFQTNKYYCTNRIAVVNKLTRITSPIT